MATRTKTTGGVTAAPPVCKRRACRNHLTDERVQLGAVFCSPKCKRRNSRERSPSHKRYVQRAQAQQPYVRFLRATDPRGRTKVPLDDKRQRAARTLIAQRVVVAYENASGLIRDVGVAKDPQEAGTVFSRRQGQEARAAA